MDKRQAYYTALLKVFETAGWQLFVEDCEMQVQHAKDSLPGVADLRQLGWLQGRLSAFAEIAALEEHIVAQVAGQKEDADLQL